MIGGKTEEKNKDLTCTSFDSFGEMKMWCDEQKMWFIKGLV